MESFGRQSEEMVHKGKGINENKIEKNSKNEGLNVMYTNIDGLIHRKMELQNYLKEKFLDGVFNGNKTKRRKSDYH